MTTKYAQTNTFYQAGSGNIVGNTTITLNKLQDIYGNVLTMANFGSKGYCTAEPQTNNEDAFIFTGITANVNGTYTLTGVSSILAVSPYTEGSGMTRSHAGGTSVVVTDNVAFWATFGNKENNETINSVWGTPNAPINPNDFTNKAYIDGIVIAGGIDASSTIKGISKLSINPVSPTNPIAVGNNDTRVPPIDTSTMTAYQVAALAGTGTPNGTTGKYVTNDDTSATPSAGKVVRFDGSGNLPASSNTFTTLTSGEAITAGAPVAAGFYQADGGVLLDAKTSQGTTSSSTVTKSFTIGNNTNRILIVVVQGRQPITVPSITSVNFNGVAMTLLSAVSDLANCSAVYYTLNPAVGTANLIVTFSGSCNSSVTLSSYYNVDQTGSIDTSVKLTGGGTTFTVTGSITPSVDGCLLFVSGTATGPGLYTGSPSVLSGILENTTTVTSYQTFALGGDNGFVIPKLSTSVSISGTSSDGVGVSVVVGLIALKPATIPTIGKVVNASAEALTSYSPVTTTLYRLAFIGFAMATVAANASLQVQIGGILTTSGLTPMINYYLGDTPGTIQTTAGTNTGKVGRAISATQLLITNIW